MRDNLTLKVEELILSGKSFGLPFIRNPRRCMSYDCDMEGAADVHYRIVMTAEYYRHFKGNVVTGIN